MEYRQRSTHAPWRLSLLLSVVVLNVCLPSLVLSYGILLVHSVSHGVAPWSALVTPTLFTFVFCMTQCWCRDAADSWGGDVGYRVMAAVGLLLVVIGVLACAFTPYALHPVFYGIGGGLGSSLISAQVDAVIFDTYDTRLGIVRGLCFVGQAVGQFIFPHILSMIIDHYGLSMTYLLLSGIMLQTLPTILLLKVRENVRRPISYTRYSDVSKTYAFFNNDVSHSSYTNELQLHDLSRKCWKSPSDDNLHREDDNEIYEFNGDNVNDATITPPPSPEEKRRNIFGVEILPEIPEESEDSEESDADKVLNKNKTRNKERLSAVIKRLSTLGDNFDECISKQIRKDSVSDINENQEYTEVEVTYDNISPMTEIQRETVFNSFSFRCQSMYFNIKRKIWIPSYRLYRTRRRIKYVMCSINDTLIKPLTRSLSCWRFYPALLLCFSKLSLTAISLPLLPLISLQIHPKISLTEMNFLMSLHAFTWICFLLTTPWVARTSKRNLKYAVVFGLIITTTACFLVSESDNHDSFSVGCIVAGFGFGAITSCWEPAVQDFIGARKWSKVHSTLETLSGTCLAVFVICLSYMFPKDTSLQMWFVVLGSVLAAVTALWVTISLVSFCKTEWNKLSLTKKWFS